MAEVVAYPRISHRKGGSRVTSAQVEKLKRIRAKHDLMRVGQMMSNVFHNIKQSEEIPDWLRNKARDLQEQWDKAKSETRP
jgi:hypothetical protein